MSPPNHLANYSAYLQLMRVHRPIETVQETLARHVLPVENPYGVGYFTGFLLSQERRMLVFCTVPIGTFLLLWPTLWALWLAGKGPPEPTIEQLARKLQQDYPQLVQPLIARWITHSAQYAKV